MVIPCCPGPEAMNLGLQMAAKRGRFGFFSGLMWDECFEIDLNLIHYKELCVVGGYGCSIRHNRTALEFLGSGAVKVKDLITRSISLDEVEQGIGMVKDMNVLSTVIVF